MDPDNRASGCYVYFVRRCSGVLGEMTRGTSPIVKFPGVGGLSLLCVATCISFGANRYGGPVEVSKSANTITIK